MAVDKNAFAEQDTSVEDQIKSVCDAATKQAVLKCYGWETSMCLSSYTSAEIEKLVRPLVGALERYQSFFEDNFEDAGLELFGDEIGCGMSRPGSCGQEINKCIEIGIAALAPYREPGVKP